ncbi:MAG: hypothetical protein J0M11_21490 [Anaerolineae bacterium]|nr:hypothetical protein [Anaerolineae bacterium]
MAEKQKYSLVWKECSQGSDLARRFYVPEFTGFLPFFIWGAELEKMEHGGQIELHEQQLLKGILYGLYEYENAPKPWQYLKSRQTLIHLLDILGKGYGFKDPEIMILDTAANVRELHGNEPSFRMLDSGTKLIPASSKIKSDWILDLWNIAADDDTEEDGSLSEAQEGMLEQILLTIKEINFQDVHPNSREILPFLGAYATVLLKRPHGFPEFFADYIVPNVRNKALLEKMNLLFRNSEAVQLLPVEQLLR